MSRDGQHITALSGQTDDKPEVSIDVSALGGMYAGKINLVGTEKGVGVHNAGELGASAGSITLTADGKIVNTGAMQAQQDIRLSSQQDIRNSKQIYSQQNIHLNSQKAIVNEGSFLAKHDVVLKGSAINSTKNSTVAAGIDEKGKLTEPGNIIADANQVSLTGKNLAGQHIRVNAQKNIHLANSQNIAESVTLTAENIDINAATIKSEKDITLQASNAIDSRHLQAKTNSSYSANANTINNQQSVILANKDIAFSAHNINNAQSKFNAGSSINFNAEDFIDNHKATLLAEGAINLQSQQIINNESLLVSHDHLQIKAKTLENQKSTLQSKKDLTIASHQIDNQQSELLTEGALTIHANQINNQKAALSAKGDINIHSALMNNEASTFISENTINLNVKQFFNQYAKLTALHNIAIDGQQVNNQSAELKANGDLSINSTELNNQSARLLTNSTLTLQGKNINNHHAELSASDRIAITAEQLWANEGIFISNQDIHITSSHIEAQKVKVKAKGDIKLNATDDIDATNGLMVSEKQASITANMVKLNEVTLSAKDDITVSATSQLDNNNAKWISEGHISADAQTINNQNSSISSYKNIFFKAPHLNNHNSKLLSYGKIDLASNIVNNQNTLINALADIHIQADDIDNQNAQIISQQSINIQGKDIDNRHLAMQSGKALSMAATNKLNNADATLISGDKLNLESLLIDNQRSKIKSHHDLTMQGKSINNQQSTMLATGNVGFTADEQLDNQEADIRTQNKIDMVAKHIHNQNSLLAAGGEVKLNANELNSQSSILKADDHLRIKAKKLNSTLVKWVSQNAIILESDEINNQSAVWKADKGITVKANDLNNNDATLISGAQLALTAKKLANQSAYIHADKGINIQSTEFDNQSATLITNDSIHIDANKTNNQDGTLSAKQNITVNSDEINNQNALWLADKHISIHANNLDNREAALQANQGMQINVNASLANQHALLISGKDGLIIHADDLDNDDAELSSKGLLAITANNVNNHQAQLVAESDLTVNANHINNQSADIQAKGDVTLAGQTLDNRQAKLLSMGNIELQAENNLTNNQATLTAMQQIQLHSQGAIDNQHSTMVANKGILIEADSINNSQSKLETASLLKIIANAITNQHAKLNAGQIELKTQSLENQQADMIAKTLLHIQADKIANNQARLLANDITINANQLSGDGELLAENDIALNLTQAFDNKNSLLANNDILINASQITNDGKISSGQAITLRSDEIKNTATGIIESEEINTEGRILENKGLIDGGEVNLNASQRVDNLDGARLYGDWIYIKAHEVNNRAPALTSPIAPTIAAREALLLDVNTLNNTNHALILSLGDMYIEGQTLNNHSARIEATDDMTLNVNQINNINDHIETEDVLVDSQHIVEYSPLGDARRYKPDEVSIRTSPKKRHRYPVLHSNNGAFDSTYKYHKYDYTRNIYETKIKSTAPAEIISGKNLVVQSDHLENDNSKIIAGNALDIMTGTLNNHSLKGQRTVTDTGDKIYHYRDKGHRKGKTVYTKRAEWKDYKNQFITTIDLEHAKIESHSNVDKTNVDLQPREEEKVSVGHIVNPIVTEIKNEKHLDNSLEDIINQGKEKGNVSISTESPIHDLPITQPILPPEKVEKPDAPIIDDNQKVSVPSEAGQSHADSIIFVEPNLTLPQNSLSIINKDPQSNYLVETDSRFTNRKKWLSSDYMLNQLRVDPNNIQKRLGDGYYEQQLIREQIATLTGHRYIGDYSSDLEQYKALMNAGATFAKQYGLSVGASLSAEQMKALTSDIVWLESKTVMVDGQPVSVLVPQVYLVNRPQLTSEGALLSGKSVTVLAEKDIESSGAILGKNRVALLGNNVNNQGLIDAGAIIIQAKDSINSSGKLKADRLAYLQANNDINLNSTTSTTETHYGASKSKNTVIDQVSSLSVTDGDIHLKAGHDINLGAALVINGGEDGVTNVIAGHDINLSTLKTESYQDAIWNKNHSHKVDIEDVVGSELLTQGDLNLIAGHDILAKSAALSSDKRLNILAEHDINIGSEQARLQLTEHHKAKTKGLLNKGSITEDIEVDNITQKGSGVYGDRVNINAGNHLTVTGSEVVGTHNVNLGAGKDITIDAAEESYYRKDEIKTKKSGLMGSGGIGFTAGKEKESLKQTNTEQAFVGSVIGSTDGNVKIQAGKDLNIKGSDVIAQRDIRMQGENVNIEALDAKTTYQEEYERKKSGVTVAVTGTVSDIYNANQTRKQAEKQKNDKTKALMNIKAGLQAGNAALETGANLQNGTPEASIGINVSVGSEKTQRTVNQEQHTVVSSSISAGRNVSIIATGNGEKESGDINIIGSQVSAGHDAMLKANHDVNIIGQENTTKTDTKEKNSSGSVGVGYNFGGQKNGFNISASASQSKSREKGNGTDWTESVVEAGNKLTIITGNDANIIAGQVKGDRVVADIGHDLNIESKQDSDEFHSKSSSTSVGGSVSLGGGGSFNASASKTKMDSNWQSVTDQSGIFAGKGGFDIKVGNNTDLKGAVIASEAKDKSQNRLDTGTISFSDIENKADYKVSSSSASVSSSGMPSMPTSRNKSESERSTTHSAVSEGTIIIRNKDEQKQDINELSWDTEHANNELNHIFNKEKEQDIIEQTQLVSEIGGETLTMLNHIDRMRAESEAKKAVEKAKEESKNKGLTEEEQQKIYEKAYEKAMNQGMSAMGSETRQGIDMAVSLINGLISGDMTGAAAGALAPKIATIIKQQTEGNTLANTVSHAILGAVVAELQGNSALVGGLGAAASERGAEVIAGILYPDKDIKDLSQEERQKVSALSQLATGLAIAAAGGDIQDVNTGVAAGKNAVENNYLSKVVIKGCSLAAPCRGLVTKKIIEYGVKAGITAAVAQSIADNISSEDLDHLITLLMMGNDEITNRYLKELESIYAPSTILIPNYKPRLEGYPIPEPQDPLPGYQPLEPDELGSTHTGGDQIQKPLDPLPGYQPLDPEQLGPNHTGGNQIPENDWRDYALNAEITRGEHAEIRNKQGRPVGQVINDIENSRPSDILVQDDGRWVVLGPNGRVHIIEPDGEVVTSYKNPRNNTTKRIKDGRWGRPSSEKLQEFRDKFSNYFKG
ncbi:hemagglutinin repeat-containing protein [Gilliamella sp. ESL0250]|uniref:hemagglutinin repeat-containing protein n=1 Tax=Gilliamella sp. ESL0250 TaxID=2705036 RepID=UPI003144DA97